MALSDDIAAVRARTDLNDDEKRREVYRIKGTALRNDLAAAVGVPLTLFEFTITLTRLPQYDSQRNWLMVWCSITKSGVPVPLDLPLCFVNPPIMAPTGPGGAMREDVRGAALQMIRDVVG